MKRKDKKKHIHIRLSERDGDFMFMVAKINNISLSEVVEIMIIRSIDEMQQELRN